MHRFGLTLTYCSISFEAVATQNNPPLGIIITSRVFRNKGLHDKETRLHHFTNSSNWYPLKNLQSV